jgi:hypothetical protein
MEHNTKDYSCLHKQLLASDIFLYSWVDTNDSLVEGEDEDVDEDLVEQIRELGEIKITLHRKMALWDSTSFPEYRDEPRSRNAAKKAESAAARRQQKLHYRAHRESRLSRLESLQGIPEKALKGRAMSLRARYITSTNSHCHSWCQVS